MTQTRLQQTRAETSQTYYAVNGRWRTSCVLAAIFVLGMLAVIDAGLSAARADAPSGEPPAAITDVSPSVEAPPCGHQATADVCSMPL